MILYGAAGIPPPVAEPTRMTADAAAHIRASCPRCLSVYRVSRKNVGTKIGCPRCGHLWTAAEEGRPAAGDRWIGRRLGNYRLIRLLGRGSNGVVYEAIDQALDRRVAVKVLPEARAGDPQVLQNLLLEAREAAKLDHPNTLKVRHVGADQGTYFVVSELIEGGSAADYILAHGAMSPAEATRVVVDVARALSASHALGIIHRNIKPSNILCGRDGVVKLTDFGLEKRSDAASLKTASGRAMGSALFMSPEHFVNAMLDPRSDLYSLGAVYFCLLTGRPPFEAETLVQAANLHLNAPIPDARKVHPSVPADCAAICAECLAKEPESRYQSADDLLADLDALGLTAPSGSTRLPIDGSVRWSDFIAAQTGSDPDSILHLPELDAASALYAAVKHSGSGRLPATKTTISRPAVILGPPETSRFAALLLPALVAAVILGLVLALVLKVATVGTGDAEAPTDAAHKKKSNDEGFDAPPPTRNEQRETEAALAIEKLNERADRKHLPAAERGELIAEYETLVREYEGTIAAQNAVIFLRMLKRESQAATALEKLLVRLKNPTPVERQQLIADLAAFLKDHDGTEAARAAAVQLRQLQKD
jgi:predicted Zn finger-like uncharacterized protein